MTGFISRWAFRGMLALAVAGFVGQARAEPLRIAISTLTTAVSTFYLANDLGYFKDEGLDVEFSKFENGTLLITALTAGQADVGTVGYTAAFFNAAQGADLKVIGGMVREAPGFRSTAFVVSNKAYDAGMKTLADWKGKKIGINSMGGSPHYSLLMIAKKYGFPVEKANIALMGTNGNSEAAIKENVIDGTVTIAPTAIDIEKNGFGHIVAWMGDEVPWTQVATFTRESVIQKRHDDMLKMMRAVQRANQAYDRTFQQRDASGKIVFGPDADKYIDIIAKGTTFSPDAVRASLPYIDPTMNIVPSEVAEQVANWKEAGMVDPGVDPAKVIDLSLLEQMHKDAPAAH